jgi:predicted nucleic acid-binding protein
MLIIDDKAGRTAATGEGIKCIGILGVLVTAKVHGHLETVAPVLAELEANRFFFSEAVKRQVLSHVNEPESTG